MDAQALRAVEASGGQWRPVEAPLVGLASWLIVSAGRWIVCIVEQHCSLTPLPFPCLPLSYITCHMLVCRPTVHQQALT